MKIVIRKDAFVGSWQIVGDKPLGKGGNSIVWQAKSEDGRDVAIKFLFEHLLTTSRYKRFIDEITFHKTLGARKGILPLVDSYLPDSPSVSDRPWLVTRLATPLASALSDMLNDLRHIVESVHVIASTLKQIHDDGAAHRDIKPDNLFYFEGGAVIGDFGLVDYPGKQSLTSNSERLGPLFYVAPEMMEHSDDCDPKPADVYSFAKTLWVLATGQHYPLPGELRIDIPQARLSTYVQNNRAQALDFLLEQATRHDPAKRPSMGEFATELSAWLTPITTNSVPDMAHLAARFRPLVTLAKNNMEAIAAKEESYRQPINKLTKFLEEVHSLVSNATGLINVQPPRQGIRSRTEFSKYFPYSSGIQMPPSLHYLSTCHQQIRARTLFTDLFIDFYYGFVFEVNPDGISVLTGGMVLDYGKNSDQIPFPFPRRKPRILRQFTSTFPFGSIQQELEISKLLNDFRSFLPEALGFFADVIANPETL